MSSSVVAAAVTLTLAAVVRPGLAQQVEKPSEQRFFDWTALQFDLDLYNERRTRLMSLMWDGGGGVLLLPSAHGRSHGETFRQLNDFLYFTGLELPGSVLVIDADAGRSLLFTPLEDERFTSEPRPNDFPGRRLARDPELATRSGLSTIRPYEELAEIVQAWTQQRRIMWVNLDRPGDPQEITSDFVTDLPPAHQMVVHLRNTYPSVRLRNAYHAIARLRMVKSPEEIDVIRRVSGLTTAAIRVAAGHVRDGVDERTIEGELEAAFKRGGSQRVAFSSIVKSGPNSLWPWRVLAAHYDRRNRTFRDGELVILDVGAELDYYVSDVGRTLPVSGRFTPEQRRTLEMVTAVADTIIAAIRPGVTFARLTQIARANIPESERRYMETGSFFGHHVGLATGDPSLLEAPLAPGMVFTVEPWYYNHDREIAVFVEDMVLVTGDGAEVLTASLPRSANGLERLIMAGR